MDLCTLIKKPVLITEWKLFAAEEQIDQFFAALKAHPNFDLHTYLIAVPYTYLEALKAKIDAPQIIWGCREMNSADPGQFTETIAGQLLNKKGASFVLIGTNDYRKRRHESHESINRKVHAALAAGVLPLLCFAEYEEMQSEMIMREQFEKDTAGLTTEQLKNMMIVFEAPWLETTLLELSAKMVLERYALYRKVISESLGTDLADDLHYAFGFSDQIKKLESLYGHLSGYSFYTSQPKSLLDLLDIASHMPKGAIEPESQAPEIALPIDIEFESELISSNIVPEANLSSEEILPSSADKIEDEPPETQVF